jgi:hypothetical protein
MDAGQGRPPFAFFLCGLDAIAQRLHTSSGSDTARAPRRWVSQELWIFGSWLLEVLTDGFNPELLATFRRKLMF